MTAAVRPIGLACACMALLVGLGGGAALEAAGVELSSDTDSETAAHLIAVLTKAHAEGRLDEKLKVYTTPRLLIIDEIGYLSYDARAADLLFQVVSRRYEKKSLVLTTNLAFKDWPSIFPNAACATALIDRVIQAPADEGAAERVRGEVRELCGRFPLYGEWARA